MELHSNMSIQNSVTITEIIDDLRAAEEIIRRFERRYWISSADFYDLYQQGILDDGDNIEDFVTWAGFYTIKLDREESLQELSHKRTAQLLATMHQGVVTVKPMEPALEAA